MPSDFIFKQGDTHIVATDTLSYSDGSSANLTGASVQFVMRALSANDPLALTGQMTVTNPSAGGVQYSPSAADVSTPGQYMANWVVTFADGSVMTFPTVGYLSVSIEQNLTTAGGGQLVSLPDLKDYLTSFGVGVDHSHDAKLLRYIAAATPLIENVVGPVIVCTIEEWHDGGNTWISLRRRPSTALGTSPVLTLVACSEYMGPIEWPLAIIASPAAGQLYSCMLDPRLGRVVRRTAGGGVQPFPNAPQAVHAIYETGQQTVPDNVREAALETIRVNYETTMGTGGGSRSIADDQDVSGPPLGFYLPRRALELLAPMRRFPSFA